MTSKTHGKLKNQARKTKQRKDTKKGKEGVTERKKETKKKERKKKGKSGIKKERKEKRK